VLVTSLNLVFLKFVLKPYTFIYFKNISKLECAALIVFTPADNDPGFYFPLAGLSSASPGLVNIMKL
jgi:hypothetical protein